jgi:hypothetical protein
VSTQGPSEVSSGASGPTRPGRAAGGGSTRPPGAIQPVRALAVILIAAVVVVVVLARMSGAHLTAAPSTTRVATTTVPTTRPGPTTSTPTTAVVATTTTTTIPPSSVLVLVLNGWTTRHAALYYKNQLAPHGYDLRVPIYAATDTNQDSGVFFVHAQYEPTALVIAGDLGIPSAAVVAPSSTNDTALTPADLDEADVIVLVGANISGKVPAGYNG